MKELKKVCESKKKDEDLESQAKNLFSVMSSHFIAVNHAVDTEVSYNELNETCSGSYGQANSNFLDDSVYDQKKNSMPN